MGKIQFCRDNLRTRGNLFSVRTKSLIELVSKMEVICDTDIWYRIAEGTIDTSALDSAVKLVFTYVNMREFRASHKSASDPLALKGAAIAMLGHASIGELAAPMPHLAKLDPHCPIALQIGDGSVMYDELQHLVSASDKDLTRISKLMRGQLTHLADDLKDGLGDAGQYIKLHLASLKGVTPSMADVRNHMSWCVTESTQHQLAPGFDWTRVELMAGVGRQWFEHVSKQAGKKIRANDFADWWNMVYVQPGRQFWVNERQWVRYATEAGLGHYIFRP